MAIGTACLDGLAGLGAKGRCIEAARRRWHEDLPRTIMRDGTPFTREKWEARWKVERPVGNKRAEAGEASRQSKGDDTPADHR